MKNLTEQDILNYFPQLNLVQNKELVTKTCQIWLEAFNNSSWENIEDAQFATRAKNVSLVKHTENVTANVVFIAENTAKKFGYAIDMDTLIISAVLHDVCKLEENDMGTEGPGTCQKNAIGDAYQHGFLSGYYTQKYNMPIEITSFVIAHSGQSKMLPKKIEFLILYYADMMDADLHFVEANTTLCLELH